ncbi:electron transfer flavoprotein-ubiquinone oxidoreductase [Gammaproteobacteria bacterium 45_16_T64]|nr:electron transfer flavoprotein-ubiquinone oxidoreductase [Gammaproteobacteria bacterium 45_16_T64]
MNSQTQQRESLEYDVVIVGAGPAGLAAACRIRQLSSHVTVCVLEKGSEVGAHILSGAIMQPTAMNELFPEWQSMGAPLNVPVTGDEIYYLTNQEKAIRFPKAFEPITLRNHGNYIVSLGNVCRWLAEQAEALGVDIYPGFSAADILYGEDNQVIGVLTADAGIDQQGKPKDSYMPGMELIAKYTVFSEGCRGHLGKQLIQHYQLDKDKDPQHYGLGIKELWEIPEAQHNEGLVIHTAGWPTAETGALGGGFCYHLDNNQVSLGYITDLSYTNTHCSPFDEMQRWKLHPKIKQFLVGGKRISYGARALAKGGLQSLPKMVFPGGILVGCDAGTLNNAKIKGSHTAMKSGMLAAEAITDALTNNQQHTELTSYTEKFEQSWIYEELQFQRNFGPARHRFGDLIGGAISFLDTNILGGKLPITLNDPIPDHESLRIAERSKPITYPKPDGVITFSKLDSVFLSNTNHAEDQPCHLILTDKNIPIRHNLALFDEPAQRYCPAGVYEIIDGDDDKKELLINSQNCLHCKTCDIKDPMQNIEWRAPEAGGGPNYPNM